LIGTPNPQPAFFLVAAAIRLAHSIGLHKRGSTFRLNPVEAEQRKRVFWIAYMLDKEWGFLAMLIDVLLTEPACASAAVDLQLKMMMI
jgi:hypothetical protein